MNTNDASPAPRTWHPSMRAAYEERYGPLPEYDPSVLQEQAEGIANSAEAQGRIVGKVVEVSEDRRCGEITGSYIVESAPAADATAGAPAAPGLSSLTKREALNAKVAETQGATWEVASRDEDAWLLFDVGGWVVGVLQKDGEFRTLNLDYAGVPSAWGALMEKERVALVPYSPQWAAFTPTTGGYKATDDVRYAGASFKDWQIANEPGTSVCAAVLVKYGIDPSPYIGD